MILSPSVTGTTMKRGMKPCSILFTVSVLILILFVYAYTPVNPTSNYYKALKHDEPVLSPPRLSSSEKPVPAKAWEFQPDRDAEDYGLTDNQCSSAFPKLFIEIDKAVARRENNPITMEELDSREKSNGLIRGMIFNAELLITEFTEFDGFWLYSRPLATLHSLNRALKASPEWRQLPNIEFALSVQDYIDGPQPIWTYTKREDDDHAWIIPDFGYWSWPEVGVGSYSKIRRRIRAVDEGILEDGTKRKGMEFEEKEKKLIWRGAAGPNSLREKLRDVTHGKPWADIEFLDWQDKENIKDSLLPMEEHCKYQFIAHVEGKSYSGRGKYLHNCHSVVIAHKLDWIEAHHGALSASEPEQNFVEVDRDWSDLADAMQHLLQHPEEAKRIADNGVRTFRDRYLSPAAEACYWRRLVRSWSSVANFTPEFFSDGDRKQTWRGVPFESFALKGSLQWEIY